MSTSFPLHHEDRLREHLVFGSVETTFFRENRVAPKYGSSPLPETKPDYQQAERFYGLSQQSQVEALRMGLADAYARIADLQKQLLQHTHSTVNW